MGKLHQPHSPPKASSPQSYWAVASRATQLSPQPSLAPVTWDALSVPGSQRTSCQHWQFYIPFPSQVYLWRCF